MYECRFIFIKGFHMPLYCTGWRPAWLPQQGHVSWICPGSRVSIGLLLPCKRMMQSDLSHVNVALFLSSRIGTELPSLSLKSVEHVDWQFYQATQAYNFVDCVWYQSTRSQSSAHLLEPNAMLRFLRDSIPALPPSWYYPYCWDSMPDRCGLFSCWKHSRLAIKVTKVKVCESMYFYWKLSRKMLEISKYFTFLCTLHSSEACLQTS